MTDRVFVQLDPDKPTQRLGVRGVIIKRGLWYALTPEVANESIIADHLHVVRSSVRPAGVVVDLTTGAS